MIKEITAYEFHECIVLVSQDAGRIHLSISHPNRLPTWDEVKRARYEFMPDDIWVVMVLPPKSNYVNIYPFCFHLWETRDPDAAVIWRD